MNELPHSRLFKNPIEIGSFVKDPCRCACCGQMVDYIYIGPVISSFENAPEDLCADCILSGKAHKRFNITFNDPKTQLPLLGDSISPDIIREFAERTPGLCGDENLEWQTHCNDICTLVNVSSDLKQYKRLPISKKEHLEPYETVKHFTFECRHCKETKYTGYKTYDLNLNFCKKEISVLIKDILDTPNQFSNEIDIQCNAQIIKILEGLYHIMGDGYQSFFDSSPANATRHEILSELDSLYRIIEERFYTVEESALSQMKSVEDDVLRFRGLCFHVYSGCITADQEDLELLSRLQEIHSNRENRDADTGNAAATAFNKEERSLLFEANKKIRKKHGLPNSRINFVLFKGNALKSRIKSA